MKARITTGALALSLALALAACGGGGDNTNLSSAAGQAPPLTQIAAPNNGDWTETVAQTPEGGFRMGNPDAPVKLVEYASITCPHCGEFAAQGVPTLRDVYVRSGQVSWEYRPYLLFPTDPGIFMLLRCQGPAPFFRLTEQLYADQPNWMARLQAVPQEQLQQLDGMPPATRAAALVRAGGLDQFFRQRGMPESRMNSCLADPQNLQQLSQITQRATSEQGVTGTPTFFINGTRQEAGNWAQLEPLLRTAVGS
jgi:protein-disulfide isomerase